MTMKELAAEITKKEYSNIPEHARPRLSYSDGSANDLTKAIIDYFNRYKGWKASRQASEGRYIQGREYKDFMGRSRQEKGMYIPRNKAAKGCGDIRVTVPPQGRTLEIEVKHGKDRQSEDQKQYQAELEAMGGIYWIVKTWEDFQFQVGKL